MSALLAHHPRHSTGVARSASHPNSYGTKSSIFAGSISQLCQLFLWTLILAAVTITLDIFLDIWVFHFKYGANKTCLFWYGLLKNEIMCYRQMALVHPCTLPRIWAPARPHSKHLQEAMLLPLGFRHWVNQWVRKLNQIHVSQNSYLGPSFTDNFRDTAIRRHKKSRRTSEMPFQLLGSLSKARGSVPWAGAHRLRNISILYPR